MLGYITALEAKKAGFTHHGKYFGIPVWIADPDGMMVVATKWAPMEYLMDVWHVVESFVRSTFYPHEPASFQFLIGPRIDGGDE